MIQLVFTYNRETLNFLVKGKEIFYTDRKWKAWIRCLPPPENFMKTIQMSRNRIPASIGELFKFTDEEMEQYKKAETEKELAENIVNDAKLKGCKLVKMEEVQDESR
jgi:hypothetical protein